MTEAKNRIGYSLDQSPFYMMRAKSKLAKILGLAPAELRRLSNAAENLYTEFEVPKKSGGTRQVENPNRQLKLVQARIARLLGRICPPDYLFCPVKGRCYVSNAAKHRGNRVVKCLDVRKYFPSTSSRRVYWFFNRIMKCENDIAAILTSIATYCGHLPTGSPLSPIMAFFAHYDVWQNISDICSREGYILTVYIDDVTISGRSVSASVLWEIKREIHKSGLRYHKEKIYIDRPAEITGVIVNGKSLSPPHRQFKKLNQIRSALKQPLAKQVEVKFNEQLAGLNGQIAQITRIAR
jgi:retron-type reverse transcriptase